MFGLLATSGVAGVLDPFETSGVAGVFGLLGVAGALVEGVTGTTSGAEGVVGLTCAGIFGALFCVPTPGVFSVVAGLTVNIGVAAGCWVVCAEIGAASFSSMVAGAETATLTVGRVAA